MSNAEAAATPPGVYPNTTEGRIGASGGSIHDFRKATRKMRWWYESMADFMVANPAATQIEIAAHFGKNPATISTVISTDAFKAYLRQRRAIHVEKLDQTVRDKLFQVADRSLDHILATLDKKRDTIPLEMLQRTAESSLKSLGYGVAPPGGTTVNVSASPQTVHVAVSLDDLELARAALRRNQNAPVIDHESALLERGATGSPGQANSSDAGQIQTLKDLA